MPLPRLFSGYLRIGRPSVTCGTSRQLLFPTCRHRSGGETRGGSSPPFGTSRNFVGAQRPWAPFLFRLVLCGASNASLPPSD